MNTALDNYRLTSDLEPDDALLEKLMHEVATEAHAKAIEAEQQLYKTIQSQIVIALKKANS